MSNSKNLIKDTIIYGIGTFGSRILTFLLLPLYTHYFTTKEFGTWDLISVTISLIIPFISHEVLSAVYRWLLEENDIEKRKIIISTGFFYTCRNLLFFNIVALVLINMIEVPNIILILCMINFSILSEYIQKCLRGLGHNIQFALFGIIFTLVNLFTNIICIFVFQIRIETLFIASIVSSVTVLIIGWNFLKFHKYLSLKSYSKKMLKTFLKYSFPMVPGVLCWWIMSAFDRFIINLYLGEDAIGIYAISNRLPAIILMISSIFQLAWQDNAIKIYKNDDRDQYYTQIFKRYFRFMATSCIILIASNRFVIELIVGSQFQDAWKYTGLLYIASLFSAFSSFWGAGYHGSKNTKIILKTTLIGAVVNIIMILIMINYIGLYAAPISTLLGFFFMWLSRLFDKNKLFEINFDKRDFSILMLLIITILLSSFIQSNILDICLILFAIIIFIAYNKEIFNELSNFSRRILSKKKQNLRGQNG
jgi:O-antigen/teichoic acid export membrane protein